MLANPSINIFWAFVGGYWGIDKCSMKVYVVSNACYSAQKNEFRDAFKDLKLNFMSIEFFVACVALGRMAIWKSAECIVSY